MFVVHLVVKMFLDKIINFSLFSGATFVLFQDISNICDNFVRENILLC